jgi:hypothetical protein
MSNINDLPAFPPKGMTKEKAEELLKIIDTNNLSIGVK